MGKLGLAIWFVCMVMLGAGLLAKHIVAMPTPAVNAATLDALRTPEQRGRWLAVHALYADCRCSQRIADHLASTTRPDGWSETVLWVGDAEPPRALTSKLTVFRITASQLADLGVEAAPSMILADPSGHVRYAGGYTDRKQGPDIADRRIMSEARTKQQVAPLPLFGCPVSERLHRELATLPAP